MRERRETEDDGVERDSRTTASVSRFGTSLTLRPGQVDQYVGVEGVHGVEEGDGRPSGLAEEGWMRS